MTQSFQAIHQRALKRKGGEQQLAAWLPDVLGCEQVAQIDDNRFLAEMTRCVFQAGFVYRVINNKWDGFEQAFWQFAPEKLRLLSPEHIERLAGDERIVRNLQKINSVPTNARFVYNTAREYGGFGQFIASWPKDDLVGLFRYYKKHGARLGGMTGPRSLRNLGVDVFILTADVIRCLQLAGVEIKDNPTSLTEMTRIQQAFNHWHDESGLPYAHISRICACSVGENYPPQ